MPFADGGRGREAAAAMGDADTWRALGVNE
jgi:hypothetical protein